MKTYANRAAATLGAVLLSASALMAQDLPSSSRNSSAAHPVTQLVLEQGFRNPPASARPRVWWHWMNGNITKDGIRKDLEWMKRVGIGGMQNFDANQSTPQIVSRRLVYMTPEWQDAFHYAALLANQLGLEMAIASSPGWSETGGPWVKPEDAMKKLVWSETLASSAVPFTGRLPKPSDVSGPYQDLPAVESSLLNAGTNQRQRPNYYQDVAVLAYPVTGSTELPTPRITTGDGKAVDAAPLMDGNLQTTVSIPSGTRDKPATLVLHYDQPQTVRALTLFVPGSGPTAISPGMRPRFEASDDGQEWRHIDDLAASAVPTTVSFNPVTARFFRIVFLSGNAGAIPEAFSSMPAGLDLSALMGIFGRAPYTTGLRIAELRLSAEAKVNQFEAKAGFAIAPDYYELDADTGQDVTGAAPATVVDLTGHLKPDGSLDWTPPAGSWRIVRLGWSLTGKVNHPATDEATGLEVDKMDAAAVRRYLEHYLGMYRDAAGTGLLGTQGVRAFLTDSTEVGAFNWTGSMISDFKRLRGYDPTPWLPALTGALIGSRRESDAFLYDFRRTIADLHAAAHYGTVAAVAHEHGLKVYGESLEGVRPTLGDDMSMRSHADYPMAAMWYMPSDRPPMSTYLNDMKGASSVAHIYGQNIAAAESMTSVLVPWATGPAELRHIIDLEFACGINRPVIHTSVHQPVDDKFPGLSLGIFGQYFTRHESWAEMAKPWIDYLARNAYLLQQGSNVADVAYFYGEEAPVGNLYAASPIADAPTRYAYDFINSDALVDQLSVVKGEIVSKGGARYRVLYLGGTSSKMTLPTLRHIAALAEAGATIVGAAPLGTPSLADRADEFRKLQAKLWSGAPVTIVGKGRVIAGKNIEAALAMVGAQPDLSYTKPQSDSEILFVHRRVSDGDIYYLDNRRNRREQIGASFRVTGKRPEIWRADTGSIKPVSYRIEKGVTVVPLELEAEDSFFVVFRKPTKVLAATVAAATSSAPIALDGAWHVSFQAGRGAPAATTLATLGSLSEQSDPGVKYFSGIATYSKEFTLPAGIKPGAPLRLNLGKVGDLAEVRVNGRDVGTAWHAPYELDIGAAVKPGRNQLVIRVANLWVNRLVGDAQPGATKITYTSLPTYTAKAPLRPSGLIGPVTLAGSAGPP
jgi:hypothetical protein